MATGVNGAIGGRVTKVEDEGKDKQELETRGLEDEGGDCED